MHIRELTALDCALGFAAMRALRPALSADSFPTLVAAQMQQGYRLLGVFDDTSDEAIAVAGLRLGRNLAWGEHLYIDDLSTLPEARGKGAASLLLEWIVEEAQRLGIAQIHLDSGVQAERQDAHRLYFRAGYRISSYHFSRSVSSAAVPTSAM